MNFIKFKNLSLAEKKNESYYLVGLDIGNDSTAIAFYDVAHERPESIDLSGGYGKPSIPTVVQYIVETKEWVVGEYAILNQGGGLIFNDFLRKMGKNEYVELAGRSVSLASVFAVFIKEVLMNVKNINPKAEIVGIVAAIPAYFSENQEAELKRVFKLAGYEKELIGFVSDRECVIADYIFENEYNEKKFLVLDFGSRELRGGLYDLSYNNGKVLCICLSFYFDETISMDALDNEAYKLFDSFLDKPAREEYKDQLTGFHYQHKDMLFQKNIREKPMKLYFNFIYPPVEHKLTYQMADRLIKPYERRFISFINDVFTKSKLSYSDIEAVLCAGGGFEMLWAKESANMIFGKEKVYIAKNPKLTNALGAGILAAVYADLWDKKIVVEDTQKLENEIGIFDGHNFIVLAERNSFWWQKHEPKLVIVQKEIEGDLRFYLSHKNPDGDTVNINEIMLHGLPKRPKGVTRLKLAVSFNSNIDLALEISDEGFGELFPSTGLKWEYAVKLSN